MKEITTEDLERSREDALEAANKFLDRVVDKEAAPLNEGNDIIKFLEFTVNEHITKNEYFTTSEFGRCLVNALDEIKNHNYNKDVAERLKTEIEEINNSNDAYVRTVIKYVKGIKDVKDSTNKRRADKYFHVRLNKWIKKSIVRNMWNKFCDYLIDIFRYYEQQILNKKIIEKEDTEIYEDTSNPSTCLYSIPDNFHVNDIKQGSLDDCYLLAVLLNLIKKDPKSIKKCFISFSNGKVKFRFFKVKVSAIGSSTENFKAEPNGKVIIQVANKIDSKIGSQTTAVWVNLFEKAFAVYKNNKNNVISISGGNSIVDKWGENSDKKNNIIKSIDWGYGFIVACAITGKSATYEIIPRPDTRKTYAIEKPNGKYKKFPSNGLYDSEANKLYNFFKTNAKSKTIVASTKSKDFKHKIKSSTGTERTIWQKKDGSPKRYAGLFPNHSYAIIEDVEESKPEKVDIYGNIKFKYIILKNPHSRVGFEEYQSTKEIVEGKIKSKIKRMESNTSGKIKIELHDFMNYFGSYEIID